MLVARDDEVCARRDSSGNDLIVIGIVEYYALDAARLHHMGEALIVAQQ